MTFEKIVIFDFEDSFTYNLYHLINSTIVQKLAGAKSIELHHWTNFPQFIEHNTVSSTLVVFGPGPGHPLEYKSLFLPLSKYLHMCLSSNYYFFGVCLGHQILWSSLGMNVKQLDRPNHGHSHKIVLPNWDIFDHSSQRIVEVQRYNSLTVEISWPCIDGIDLWYDNLDLQASYNPGLWLSYQFHPESVGTSCPELLIGALTKMRYNNAYGVSNRRSLRL